MKARGLARTGVLPSSAVVGDIRDFYRGGAVSDPLLVSMLFRIRILQFISVQLPIQIRITLKARYYISSVS